ncbi:ankyrin repeat-containing protein At5g02620-like [Cryptomeria japonica]|uniref:ankyrin repeat-containing protein At5g02620-like n=1 Tax=Cryptomeria japonica TaxID=3369 RepID=UPI0027D9DC95|nr:ankyrin repeat-containing protein At5g02620-like [Cryptomeria japonica]
MDQTGYVCKGMNRRFFEAAKSGNVRALNEISPPWSVANEVTPGGNTVLHIAAYHGSLPFVQKLLQLSNANLEDGMTFLKAKNMEGNTALHEAALGGSEQVVNALLKFCPDLVNEINKAGETALFKACEGGHAKIVELLCPMTSTEYNKRFDGQTPLHLAVSKLSTDVIEKLLHHKPELATEVDNFDRTPLHMAALLPYLDNFLYPKLYRKIFLTGNMLIRNDGGLSCYKVDQNKQSALHVAVKEGNAALVEVILKYSSDCLEMVDNDGRIVDNLKIS